MSATNRAGEVERLRTALSLALPWLSPPLDDRDQSASGVAYRAVAAALATQPATSQEGEAKALVSEWQAERRDWHTNDALVERTIAFLAATPTPPTLSEDLREALTRRIDLIDVQANCLEGYAESNGYSGKAPASVFHWQATHFRDLASEMRAALARAQVKAS